MQHPSPRFTQVLVVLCLTLLLGLPLGAKADGLPGDFDYYVLSLSWSPEFCAKKGKAAPPEQCKNKHFGYVEHGLWPQYDFSYPHDCPNNQVPADVPANLVQHVLGFMPGRDLIEHEWDKHGKCSGLSVNDYFVDAEKAFDAIHIPDKLKNLKTNLKTSPTTLANWFLQSNPQLKKDSLVIQCEKRSKKTYHNEIHICLDKQNLTPRSCTPYVLRDACQTSSISVPPIP
jgi:ribonuclease T2